MSDSDQSNLREKVEAWLSTQGYPLEFQTASIFQRHGFVVRQGIFVTDSEAGTAREVDLMASFMDRHGDGAIRVTFVIECKWSVDKPWVVFAAPGGVAPAACITQSFGSKASRTVLWARAGDERLHGLGLFSGTKLAGFGGRQVFSEKRDVFYEAVQGVTSAASLWPSRAEQGPEKVEANIRFAEAVFPVIVVKGRLFEASYDDASGRLSATETDSSRLYWRGLSSWTGHACVDVVTVDALDAFVQKRRSDVEVLAGVMRESLDELRTSFEQGDLGRFTITTASRGIIGQPALLREVREAIAIRARGRARPRHDPK